MPLPETTRMCYHSSHFSICTQGVRQLWELLEVWMHLNHSSSAFRHLCFCCLQQGHTENVRLSIRNRILLDLRFLSFLQGQRYCFISLKDKYNIFSSLNISPLLFSVFFLPVVILYEKSWCLNKAKAQKSNVFSTAISVYTWTSEKGQFVWLKWLVLEEI